MQSQAHVKLRVHILCAQKKQHNQQKEFVNLPGLHLSKATTSPNRWQVTTDAHAIAVHSVVTIASDAASVASWVHGWKPLETVWLENFLRTPPMVPQIDQTPPFETNSDVGCRESLLDGYPSGHWKYWTWPIYTVLYLVVGLPCPSKWCSRVTQLWCHQVTAAAAAFAAFAAFAAAAAFVAGAAAAAAAAAATPLEAV